MPAMRLVEPEVLDELSPQDPRARRSRRDLRRVHRAMGSVSILRRAVARMALAKPPRRILELGAGDGTLLLRLARALRPRWREVQLTLLDRHDLLEGRTRQAYARLGWSTEALPAEIDSWSRDGTGQRYDLCVATLFLHHFDERRLRSILAAVAERSDALIACEPHRGALARLGVRSLGLIGAGSVTRADAATSVAAGFRGRELTALWKACAAGWILEERRAWPFTQCFWAVRAEAREAPA